MEMEKTTIYIGEVIKNVMVEKLVTKAELARSTASFTRISPC